MSRLIKAGPCMSLSDLRPVVRTPVEMLQQFQEVDDDARRILEHAQREAMILVGTARNEIQSVVDEAYQAGYHSGLKKAADEASVLYARLEADIAQVAEDRSELVEKIEPEVLKLCVEAVEKVIKHEVKTDPHVVVRMIKSCLRRIKDRSSIDVRVNPQEVAYVRERRDELLGAAEGTREVNILDDRRISPGGCMVESASGTLDARIEMQFDQIAKKIMEIYQNAPGQTDAGPD